MRLIDADAFIQRLREASEGEDEATRELTAEIHDLVEIEVEFHPIDAVEVVRCKDCKYRDADDFCTGRGYPNMLVPDDGFCEKGARREE